MKKGDIILKKGSAVCFEVVSVEPNGVHCKMNCGTSVFLANEVYKNRFVVLNEQGSEAENRRLMELGE